MYDTISDEPTVVILVRLSSRQRWLTIFDYYYDYLGKFDYDIGQVIDHVNFKEVISYS